MSGITIIGLGPGNSQQWTYAAAQLLQQSNILYLRTVNHPSVPDISIPIHSFDNYYQPNESLDTIQQRIADKIIELGKVAGVIYAVPGHPMIDDPTARLIQYQAKALNIPITIIPGISLLSTTLDALNLSLADNIQLVHATEIAALHHPSLETGRAVIINHIYGTVITGQIKQTLLNAYPQDFVITLMKNGGADNKQKIWSCTLAEMDNQPAWPKEYMTLYLPAHNPPGSFSAFQETIAHLRDPAGCPWDREQTHQTLRPYLLEETYEVLEALDANDSVALAEELGDLFLQVLLHTQIAIDTNEFNMNTVIDHINRKLIRRHPHVFANVAIKDATEVTTNWDAIKRAERKEKGHTIDTISALDGVPKALPALTQALSVSKRAVRVGFEWPNIEGVLDKVVEEAQEIVEATNQAHLETEIGDLLFSVVNLARWQKIDPESALRATNARFTQRFKRMEVLAAQQNKTLPELSIKEMEALWQEAKRQLSLALK